ncbi:hypothetical protein GGI25_002773 [Coemansia spiralis]|uniref:Uncharacterized protein n=2 Tax=Coemansia TaxID=4863 RepID=A0A9W8KY83_9FUNG|nr:hypothetical protein BX070DRAFT_138452 [Coemansia spiralis]KAJ1993482.1 hypothetical protein EDC05_002108 [Coemansia umbellata]KAJ2625276.1 hypothetical protein GGI26_000746 [Coemansia sp. RSA 1358]KAJ2677983.1 hypothetical protein GGI25_002773 [Coemansia spiralis]
MSENIIKAKIPTVPLSSPATSQPSGAVLEVPTAAFSVESQSTEPEGKKAGLLTLPESPMSHAVGGRSGISHPIAWARFKQLIDSGNLVPLGRSHETQACYEEYIARAKHQHGSVAAYLSATALRGFEPTADDGPLAKNDFFFYANEFPYHLEDGVEHWVMWCRKRLVPGFEAPDAAISAIRSRFGDVECRYFVNPVKNQSVPQLSHAHVFIKRL